jgi:hypothetical protein
MCNTIILHDQPNNHITYCKACREVHWQFNSVLITFQPDDLPIFLDSLSNVDFNNCSISFPDGSVRILIDTYHYDIRISLTLVELMQVRQSFAKACSMLNLFHLVVKPNLN